MSDSRDELEGLGTPNCPRCLTPMEAAGEEAPRWECPECGLAGLS